MHELSLALEVIDLAQREAGKHSITAIEEIRIEVGDLSGVEADAFESAMELAVKETLLEKTRVIYLRIPGKGRCHGCNLDFEMKNRTDTCPQCNCFPSEINGGDAFRVVSMLTV